MAVNFYEELNLNKEDSLEEINRTLIQLESTWKRREITAPERATKMLALIIDAKKTFESEASKQSYDEELLKDNSPPMSEDDARREEAKKWMLQAIGYPVGPNDAAKELIGRALSLSHYDDPEYGIINDRAAVIYQYNLDYDRAVACSNQAIASDPDNIDYYKTKADIYFHKKLRIARAIREGRSDDIDAYDDTISSYREALQVLLEKAQQADRQDKVEDAFDNLAATFYWDSPQNRLKAREYADLAVAAMKERLGNHWTNVYDKSQSKFIFDDIEKNKSQSSSSSGGCYIATAVYGSYDCPEVWTLRRLRDYKLSRMWAGRLFIRAYYAISPTLVRLFGRQRWFNTFWRKLLDGVVCKLKESGISDGPYYD